MKRIFLFILLFVVGKVGYSQYSQQQTMGSNNTLINLGSSNGGAIKGNIINGLFTDTTAANATHIDFYAGSQIFTTNDTSFWVRNKTASTQYWFKVGSAAAGAGGYSWNVGGNLFPVTVSPAFKLGTTDTYGGSVGLTTNGQIRLIVDNGGILNSTASTDSVLVKKSDLTVGVIAKSALVSTPTWQQTLTAGSTLTTNNNIVLGNYNLHFKPNNNDNYFDLQLGSGTPYHEFNIQDSPFTRGVFVTAAPGVWQAATNVGSSNNVYFSLASNSGAHMGQWGSSQTTSGNWVDFKAESAITGVPANDYFSVHRELWYGTAPGTSSRMLFDNSGIKLQTRKNISSSSANYKGIFIDSLHQIYLDSSLNLSSQDRLLGIINSTGQVGNITLGSGLSLSSGVLNTSGTVATPISSLTAATGTNAIDNVNYLQSWNWNSLSGKGLELSANSTAAAGNLQWLLIASLSGANATASQETRTAYFQNTHTGTSSTNIAGHFEATGGTNNYAIIVPSGGGNVGIGTSTPSVLFEVSKTSFGTVSKFNINSESTYSFQRTDATGTANGLLIEGASGSYYVDLLHLKSRGYNLVSTFRMGEKLQIISASTSSGGVSIGDAGGYYLTVYPKLYNSTTTVPTVGIVSGRTDAPALTIDGKSAQVNDLLQFRKSDGTVLSRFDSIGYLGIGTVPVTPIHVINVAEQMRIGYDASNYYKTTVGSTGGVTFDAVGSGSQFKYSDVVWANNGGFKEDTFHIDITAATYEIVYPGIYDISSTGFDDIAFPGPSNYAGKTITIWNHSGADAPITGDPQNANGNVFTKLLNGYSYIFKASVNANGLKWVCVSRYDGTTD